RDAAMLPAPRSAPLPPSYTGQVYPGGAYTITPQPSPGQGFQDLGDAMADIGNRKRILTRCMESRGDRQATAEDRQVEQNRARGRVGLRLERRDSAIVVVNVTPGGPADRAGIVVGDRLIKVGGIPVDGRTAPQELSSMVTGVPGSKVLLTIMRDDQL